MAFGEKLSIAAKPPFNFELSAQIFAQGDKQIRIYEKGILRQVIRIEDRLLLASMESVGTIEDPKIRVELRSNREMTKEDKSKAKETIIALLNLNFDLAEFYEETRNDKLMANLAKKLLGLKSPTTQFVFESLIDSIVEQQISLKVANIFERKIIKKFGDSLQVEGEIYYAYPTPKSLATASQQELRDVGLSERKAEYIRTVASLVTQGKLDLEALKNREKAEDIIEELDAIKGIGVWTAELTMLRGMHRLEALAR
jgi:DNA-3-methyladenine glycosylase II